MYTCPLHAVGLLQDIHSNKGCDFLDTLGDHMRIAEFGMRIAEFGLFIPHSAFHIPK
jgi:hypothetical protein